MIVMKRVKNLLNIVDLGLFDVVFCSIEIAGDKPSIFCTKRFKHRDVQQMQQNNCVKRVERRQRVNGRSATED